MVHVKDKSEWWEAFGKATIWTIMWSLVLLVATIFDSEFTGMGNSAQGSSSSDSTSAIPNPQKSLSFAALITSLSYIGSIGVEAIIRFFDERIWSWRAFPWNWELQVTESITIKQLSVCLIVTALIMLLIGITEVAPQYLRFPFESSTNSISALFQDKKFVTVVVVGLLFRAYIYKLVGRIKPL